MPCEKHDPRASVTTITSAFGLGFCLLSPSGHVFHTAWEPMIKSYSIDWLASQIIDINSFQTQAHPINLIDYAACVECKCSKTNACKSLTRQHPNISSQQHWQGYENCCALRLVFWRMLQPRYIQLVLWSGSCLESQLELRASEPEPSWTLGWSLPRPVIEWVCVGNITSCKSLILQDPDILS